MNALFTSEFDFNKKDRARAWTYVIDQFESFYSNNASYSVAPKLDQKAIQSYMP